MAADDQIVYLPCFEQFPKNVRVVLWEKGLEFERVTIDLSR